MLTAPTSSLSRGALVPVALVLLATCACTTVGPEPPEVTLVNLKVEDMTMLETTLNVVIRVSNPNPEPLELDGAAFKLRLNGNRVGSGMTPEALTIPRLESRTVPVTFHVSNAAAIFKLRTIIEAKAFDWGLSGKLYAVTPLGRRTLRWSARGAWIWRRSLAANPIRRSGSSRRRPWHG
jgi:LEA14-like dessication related protein